jgi:hypothetical protein
VKKAIHYCLYAGLLGFGLLGGLFGSAGMCYHAPGECFWAIGHHSRSEYREHSYPATDYKRYDGECQSDRPETPTETHISLAAASSDVQSKLANQWTSVDCSDNLWE